MNSTGLTAPRAAAPQRPLTPAQEKNRAEHALQARTESNRTRLGELLETYVQQGANRGDDYTERNHTARCVKAALMPRRVTADGASDGKDGVGSRLDFGSHARACMTLPTDLVAFLGTAAREQGNPVTVVVLPAELSAMPAWLGALPDVQTLEVHEFDGSSLDLVGVLPDHTTVEIHGSQASAVPTVQVDTDRGVSVRYHLSASPGIEPGLRV